MKRLVLIDGHAILHRAYHAFPLTLKTRRGETINAVYGFTRMLLTVLKNLKPDYVAVAFDLAEPTFRHELFIGYQAHRPEREVELEDQLKRVEEVVRFLNIPTFAVKGFEADDVIGTLAKQATKRGVEAIIVTGDRDIMQLVNDKVKVYVPVKGFANAKLFVKKNVQELLGVRPEQIIDYKAMVGDASDNYPGIPGIGPKTAVALLGKYKDLDTIYKNLRLSSENLVSRSARNNNIDRIKPSVAKKLIEGKESARLSRKLARIVTDVPIKLNLKACQVHDYDRGKATALFQRLEFRSLIKKLPGSENEEERPKAEDKNKQMKLL